MNALHSKIGYDLMRIKEIENNVKKKLLASECIYLYREIKLGLSL